MKKCNLRKFLMTLLLQGLPYTGCSLNIVFFSKISKYIPDSGLSLFPLGVSVCTQWQVKNQRCSRTVRDQKNHNILRKNTIFNEHPVSHLASFRRFLSACFSPLLPSMGRTRNRIGGESSVSENWPNGRDRKKKVLGKSQNIKKAQQLTLQPYHGKYDPNRPLHQNTLILQTSAWYL